MEQLIYLIDDDQAIRCSLSSLLSTMGWQTVTYENVLDFQQKIEEPQTLSGCLLLDIRMPGKTGLMLLEEWQQQGLEIPVIIMTGHGNIELCRRAFKKGAFEFLTKPIDADLLIETVGGALEHQRQWQKQRKETIELKEKFNTLSVREHEIALLIMEGKSSKEIANDLTLSPRTVEAHRANLFTKLEVNSLVKLIKTYGGLFIK
ncbi:LuxR family transcriptional regulator [Chania multitudinisentens RB-25]|uniref:LuxR family transcriptional regulator n=1 Tax=Chania multitudinisentens RB-25 TaxID=1441930 RepID=W0LCW7_9GAMM|nr:response regulator [Chania multitudinisentens]AHG21688.1 LuxR family transcriptional regulator [Chania multitudinisentens RB-25]